jgi:CHAD domain
VKARKVKGLEPAEPLADNAERIVRVRLDEMCGFMPQAADPNEVVALHDMRIAAKRLRYILEITAPIFGDYAATAVRLTKDVQDLLGEIHDCDVQIPEVQAFLDELVAEDASALVEAAGDAEDLDPSAVRRASHRNDHAGLVALLVHLRARRELLYRRFLELWQEYERKGYRARLDYAVGERAGASGDGALTAAADAAG